MPGGEKKALGKNKKAKASGLAGGFGSVFDAKGEQITRC